MELTLIVAALLAAAAGLVVAAAYALRAAAGHWHALAAAGWRAGCPPGRRLRARWEPLAGRIRSRFAPEWMFSVSAVLGLSVIVAATAVTGTVVEDVTG